MSGGRCPVLPGYLKQGRRLLQELDCLKIALLCEPAVASAKLPAGAPGAATVSNRGPFSRLQSTEAAAGLISWPPFIRSEPSGPA
ncbi:hypothetical protein MRX96_036137 [Rhipicephalus microplus]